MTSGSATHSDPNMIEPWRARTPQAVLAAKAARLRNRIEETCLLAKSARGQRAKNMCRRALIDAEAMIDLADEALREDWLRG
jgi:hypothetical protein